MGSLGYPKTWVPYMQSKDCSQGFCSLYCPQWCYTMFPPPPPFEFPEDNSTSNISPLVIAIIGILASAFLLISYYTIISKYCGSPNSTRRENQDPNEESEDNQNPSLHEPWHVLTTGLDDALINSITVCKYKKGDGSIEVTDCPVCLSEFQEDESLRLLPKCSHAFHVPCIDTWLKSHSNCPLCRANIISLGSNSQPPLPPTVTGSPPGYESLSNNQEPNQSIVASQDIEEETIRHSDGVPKSPLRAFSDLGNLEDRHTIIEIREEGYQSIRRSVSMDHSCQDRLLVADILRMNQDTNVQVDEFHRFTSGAGTSKQTGQFSKPNKKRVIHCVMSPVAMKRSFSSGRFLLTRQGRVRETSIPI
ncbi:zf-RING_2 domain-containing protein [Cephalotus follicularis]|uniref:RING-type E3 ubiquitin transferase n=1 Tax=Cephalotus follicularis TaxID=3775 RepID=A0A1Q3CQP1_CEPFO|nr:zf-RING_2 domain-containing protein [Cephalotus follicularis]